VPSSGRPTGPLYVIPGQVPRLEDVGEGCRFADRCEFAVPRCSEGAVPLLSSGATSTIRCIRHHELELPSVEVAVAAPEQVAQ